jgi:hypothetical protein
MKVGRKVKPKLDTLSDYIGEMLSGRIGTIIEKDQGPYDDRWVVFFPYTGRRTGLFALREDQMEEVETPGHSKELLQVLGDYAPNKEAEDCCTNMALSAQGEGETYQEIDELLAGAIYNGLRNGNWPWDAYSPSFL